MSTELNVQPKRIDLDLMASGGQDMTAFDGNVTDELGRVPTDYNLSTDELPKLDAFIDRDSITFDVGPGQKRWAKATGAVMSIVTTFGIGITPGTPAHAIGPSVSNSVNDKAGCIHDAGYKFNGDRESIVITNYDASPHKVTVTYINEANGKTVKLKAKTLKANSEAEKNVLDADHKLRPFAAMLKLPKNRHARIASASMTASGLDGIARCFVLDSTGRLADPSKITGAVITNGSRQQP